MFTNLHQQLIADILRNKYKDFKDFIVLSEATKYELNQTNTKLNGGYDDLELYYKNGLLGEGEVENIEFKEGRYLDSDKKEKRIYNVIIKIFSIDRKDGEGKKFLLGAFEVKHLD